MYSTLSWRAEEAADRSLRPSLHRQAGLEFGQSGRGARVGRHSGSPPGGVIVPLLLTFGPLGSRPLGLVGEELPADDLQPLPDLH